MTKRSKKRSECLIIDRSEGRWIEFPRSHTPNEVASNVQFADCATTSKYTGSAANSERQLTLVPHCGQRMRFQNNSIVDKTDKKLDLPASALFRRVDQYAADSSSCGAQE